MSGLPDLSRSLRYKPEPLDSELLIANNAVQTVYGEVYKVDSIIQQYAYALELIQPGATGKVAIRFLKRKRAGSEGRHPQLIQWYKSSRSARFLYIRLKPSEAIRKVKSYPIFAPVTEDVKILLREAIELMAHREKLLDMVDNLRRQCAVVSSKSVKYQKNKLEQVQEWIPVLAKRREQLIEEWQQQLEVAEEHVPSDAVPKSTKQRVAIISKTRGTRHETFRGRKET